MNWGLSIQLFFVFAVGWLNGAVFVDTKKGAMKRSHGRAIIAVLLLTLGFILSLPPLSDLVTGDLPRFSLSIPACPCGTTGETTLTLQ